MPRILRHSLVVITAVLVTSLPAISASADDTPPTSTVSPTTIETEYAYDLENDPSLCINSNPRPNCGKKVTQAGDRGGTLQYALFGILIAALGTIGVVIGRNVVRRDRELASQLSKPTSDNT